MMAARPHRRAATVLSAAVALVFLGGLGAASGSGSRGDVIDRQDVRSLRERVVKNRTSRNVTVESARAQLRRDGLGEAQVERLASAIRRRLSTETTKYVDSLRGLRFASLEEARQAIDVRERVLCYDASTWPVGFGEGRPLSFVVTQEDAEGILGKVDGMIRAAEVPLRDTVRELVSDRTLTMADSGRLRDFSRMRAKARARATIEEIRGAPFFSKADARFYVENAIADALDQIHSTLRDPATREHILDESRALGSAGS